MVRRAVIIVLGRQERGIILGLLIQFVLLLIRRRIDGATPDGAAKPEETMAKHEQEKSKEKNACNSDHLVVHRLLQLRFLPGSAIIRDDRSQSQPNKARIRTVSKVDKKIIKARGRVKAIHGLVGWY
jgi:hypothetical protein